MISAELEIVLLILALYASTCIAFVYADEGVLARVAGGTGVRIADDRIRVAGRSPILLNPFAPMFPAFRGRWGDPDAIGGSELPVRVAEAIAASRMLSPYAIVVALLVVLGIPAALMLGGGTRAIPVALLAYLAIVVLLVRLWFLRRRFALDAWKFALVAFESIACPPFAAGIVRRLALAIPLEGDLASYIPRLRAHRRARVVAELEGRCDEMASFHAEDSPERARLDEYRARIAAMAASAQAAIDDTANAAEERQ